MVKNLHEFFHYEKVHLFVMDFYLFLTIFHQYYRKQHIIVSTSNVFTLDSPSHDQNNISRLFYDSLHYLGLLNKSKSVQLIRRILR